MTRVMIVDDSLLVRMQLKQFFEEEMNFEITALAVDGHEAISLYKEALPDLVTLDITMPRKGGVETLKELINIDQNVKVLMVSAIKGSCQIMEAIELGAIGYIKKPLDFGDDIFISELKCDILESMTDAGMDIS